MDHQFLTCVDFLNENDMVTYLFNEETRYIELLLLSLEIQSLDMIKQLDPIKILSGCLKTTVG